MVSEEAIVLLSFELTDGDKEDVNFELLSLFGVDRERLNLNFLTLVVSVAATGCVVVSVVVEVVILDVTGEEESFVGVVEKGDEGIVDGD